MTTIQDITIRQGSRYRAIIKVEIEWLATLAGYSARGKVRHSRTVARVDDPIADLTPYLTVDALASTVTIDIPANISAGWTWRQGQYDLEVFDADPAHDVRFMQGTITLNPEVTH